jgi:hypothetical protein
MARARSATGSKSKTILVIASSSDGRTDGRFGRFDGRIHGSIVRAIGTPLAKAGAVNFAVRGASRALVHHLTPQSRLPEPPSDDAGVRRFRDALRSPEDRARSVLTAGGLAPEDAVELVGRGLTRARATDLLDVDLLHPDPHRYGPAMAVLSLLAEARESGALSGRVVQARLARLDQLVVVRPDGYLVSMLGGAPLEKRADLDVGQVYQLDGGVLRRLGPDGVEPTPVAELGLEAHAAGAFLDGVESVLSSVVLGLVERAQGLLHRPEETFDAMAHELGRTPETVARFIRTSPELLAAYERASPDDRTRFMGATLAQAYLAIGAMLLAPKASSLEGPSSLGAIQVEPGALAVLGARIDAAADAVALAQLGVRVTIASSGLLAESLDLHPSRDPRIGPTTIADPKTRYQLRNRIERQLGDPRDPKVGFEELLDHLELAPQLGQDAVRELKAMILERIEREIRGLDRLGSGARRAKVRELSSFARRADVEIRDALRNPDPPPPRAALSAKAQRVLRAIDRGEADVHVSSRAVAEEVLTQYRDFVDTRGWTMGEIKSLVGGKQSTYHWDDVFGDDGLLIHHELSNPHATTPHLQLHRAEKSIVRIFFPVEVR